MRRLAAERNIDVWYERVDLEVIEQYRSQVSHKVVRNFDKAKAKAESKNSLRAFTKLTQEEDGELRIVSDPPLIVPIEELVPKNKLKAVQAGSGRAGGPVPRDPLPRRPHFWRGAIASSTSPTRWSASAASGPVAGSS